MTRHLATLRAFLPAPFSAGLDYILSLGREAHYRLVVELPPYPEGRRNWPRIFHCGIFYDVTLPEVTTLATAYFRTLLSYRSFRRSPRFDSVVIMIITGIVSTIPDPLSLSHSYSRRLPALG
jgi:hypothetical protein